MKILQKQILQDGTDESMSSQRGFHVSRSAWPDSERERTITATSGLKLSELYAKSGPLGLLARMLLESSRWYSPARRLKWEAITLCSEKITEKEYCYGKNTSSRPSAVTLNEKVTKFSRLLFRLVPSERPTGETACGLLPTIQTQGLKRCNAEGKTEFMPLDLLPTPTSIDSGSGRINKSPSPGAKERPTIALAAKMGLLPTPNASEAEKYTTKYNPNSQMGKGLTAMAMNDLLPTPRANKVTDINLNNKKLSERRKANLEENIAKVVTNCQQIDGATSQLNPRFVAEMMGFPPDWTVLPFQSGEANP